MNSIIPILQIKKLHEALGSLPVTRGEKKRWSSSKMIREMTAAQPQNGHHHIFLASEQLHNDRRAITGWVLPGTEPGVITTAWVLLPLSYWPNDISGSRLSRFSWTKTETKRTAKEKQVTKSRKPEEETKGQGRLCLSEPSVAVQLADTFF
jgi:hypothetical protein